MSYAIINDGHTYKVAQIIETFKSHQQLLIIPENSKRKLKLEQTIYTLNITDIDKFMQTIANLLPDIDIQLLCAVIEENHKYTIWQLAELYFNERYSEAQLSALLFAISNHTIEFIDHKDGTFTKCSEEEQTNRKAILIEQQKQQLLFDEYYNRLIALENPNFDNNLNIIKLVNKPNKNAPEYRALMQASKTLQLTPLEVLHQVKVIENLPQFFIDTFISETFIDHTQQKITSQLDSRYSIVDNLNLDVFSIDDETTTEIDDAFSVTSGANNTHIIGIHIAAPALDDGLEDIVAEKISTIYFPGNKITMLPEQIIAQYSLVENNTLPVVSIYFVIDHEFKIQEYYSKLERVKISKNLRIEELSKLFSTDGFRDNAHHAYTSKLNLLYAFANALEQERGKPSVSSLNFDYNFSFHDNKVVISQRIRGNPIDKLVSELMILANCTWGRMLTNAFIPAIYRVKQHIYPVKMTLNANSHEGLNVSYYTWATSPLRRAADYVNQRQIINLITNNKNYYASTHPILLQVVDNFDKTYAKYLDFQDKMERYWSLKYLTQENISQVIGIFTHKAKLQLLPVPIQINTQGIITPKPRGSEVSVKIFDINLTNLTFNFKIVEENSLD